MQLDPNSPEGRLFAEFNQELDGRHATRLRGYKPKPPEAKPEAEAPPACEACAEGLCTEHGGEDTARALEALVADEG